MEREPPPVLERVAYLSHAELQKDVLRRHAPPWAVLRSTETSLATGLTDEAADVLVKIWFQENFNPKITRFGILVRKEFDVEHLGVSQLLRDLEATIWCSGSSPRAKSCSMIVQSTGLCEGCSKLLEDQEKKKMRPVLATTPLSSVPASVLVQEVRSIRTKLKSTEAELSAIKSKLERESVEVDKDVKDGLEQVLNSQPIEDPFLNLFWEEQKKAASRNPHGIRWHPTMIRFAIYLHFQSPRAYEALKSTGVLLLPNKATLRDYTNVYSTKEGFLPHVFEDLKKTASSLPPERHYVALMLDEMSIRGDLVYDRRGGTVVGFVNPLTWNFKIPDNGITLATHVLVFMIVGINNNIKKSVGYFSTRTATADVLFPLLWMAIASLEQQGLKVITVTCDKASQNQRLFRLHGQDKIVHQTENLYADDGRLLYFLSDPPHLLKTLRNNLEHSKSGGTRCLWVNDQHIWWSHITRVCLDDMEQQLRRTKLRAEHINLTPSSRMSVRLAVQVLSHTVGMVLKEYYGAQVQETATFVLKCDQFFDCLNGRSFTELITKRKPELAPYRVVDDSRFQVLESFVGYLEAWKESVLAREGFTRAEKEKMFLSHQTFEGIVTTVRGFTGATKYLLSQGVPYVLANTFCQDPLEEHFGRHRGLGARSKNPSLFEFGHQENRLQLQRSLAFQFRPKGNTAGRRQEAKETILIDDEPMAKRKRH